MPGTLATAQPAPPPQRDVLRSALLYGDINLNLIDGATIWVQSMTEVLSRAGCTVTLVLKAPVRTDRLLAPLLTLPGVTVRRPCEEGLAGPPSEGGLSPRRAARVLRDIDAERRHDLILVRGGNLAGRVAAEGGFDGRLWTYLTDIPQSVPLMTADAAASLARISRASRYLLCQTEELRCFLEQSVPEACGKCVLLPPVVPPHELRRASGLPGGRPLRLVYTGKFAPRWNTYEMTWLPRLLTARRISAELHMVGDKIHYDPADPGYYRRMRSALGPPRAPSPVAAASGVIWHGGLPRHAAMEVAASCDLGLGWRHQDLDPSLELSTKILEFGSMGLPVILNRTPMHESLLGVGYPLFVGDLPDVLDAAELAARDPAVYLAAARTMAGAAEQFTLEHAVRRVRGYLDQAFPAPLADVRRSARPLRVVVAGHDLRFFAPLLDNIEQTPDIDVRVDRWAALGEHDPLVSQNAASWADVVICEWCGPNAVWYSRNKRRGSRLLVRLHRFEMASAYPRQVRIGVVDQVICVSEHYARRCHDDFGWPAHKITAIPNVIDAAQFDRPKLDGADHHLGMIGIVPSLKRLDLALDILAELRRDDDSYLLFIKSWMPWDDGWWVWRSPQQRGYYADVLRRIQRSPLLREAVVFDDAGPDVAAWLRRVGFILSTSDIESFHVAVAEGMASGAVPVLRPWPGAETVYDARWIHPDPVQMAESVAALRGVAWRRAGAAAREAAQSFSRQRVQAAWRELLTANAPPIALNATAEP